MVAIRPTAESTCLIPPAIPGIRLFQPLATGRLSMLFHANDEHGTDCAVKLMPPPAGGDDRAVVRFYAAARAAMIFEHHRVLDVRQVAEIDGWHYQVMEHFAGGSLANHLAAHRTLPEPVALRLVVLLTEGLDALHAAGFVHRDLVPEAVLLTPNHEPVLSRFGLIYNYAGKQDLTNLWGYPTALAYSAPEQLRCTTDVHPRDDVYSLGVLLYCCLTGSLPFEQQTLQALLDEKMRFRASDQSMKARLQGVDPRTSSLICECLMPAREARPQSAYAVTQCASQVLRKKVEDCWSGPGLYPRSHSVGAKQWYLLFTGDAGNRRLRRATTEQITVHILRGSLGKESLASPDLNGQFQPLEQIAAFRSLFVRK